MMIITIIIFGLNVLQKKIQNQAECDSEINIQEKKQNEKKRDDKAYTHTHAKQQIAIARKSISQINTIYEFLSMK